MERLKAAWPPVASALLILLSFPPFNLVPVLFVALVPWLLSLEKCSSKGAWRRGYLLGLVFALGQLHWMDVLTSAWTHSFLLGLVPWFLASFAMAVYFGLLGMASRVCWVADRVWLIPVLWAGMEVFRSFIPVLAFPWGLLAMPLWHYPPFMQSAYFGSVFFVSALLVAVNLAIVLAVLKRTTVAAFIGGTAILGFTAGLIRYALPFDTQDIPVLVGQTGSDMAFGDQEVHEAATHAAVDEFIQLGLRSHDRLLVLPEGVVRMATDQRDLPIHLDPRMPTLFGAQRGTGPVYQSAVGYDGKLTWADKVRLVIFGEFVPGRNVIPGLSAFDLPTGDLSAGEHGTRALTVGGIKVGPIVCFEGMFPEIAYRQAMNGSQLLAVISDDDWFMGSSAPDEFRVGSIWRAVETGLPVVRAASLGYSMVIDGHGRILAEAPLGVKFPLQVNVPIARTPTTFPLEPVFPLLSFAMLVAVPILGRRRKFEVNHGN